MLAEILTHTPIWVWVFLAFLIYRGLLATRERDAPLGSVAILPVVLLGLSVQGMIRHYGLAPGPFCVWFAALLGGALLGSWTVRPDAVGVGVRGVLLKGSWFPLVLVLAVFLTKYVTEVMIAIHPEIMLEPDAIYGVCGLYGALTGFFVGRLARTVLRYRTLTQGRVPAPPTA